MRAARVTAYELVQALAHPRDSERTSTEGVFVPGGYLPLNAKTSQRAATSRATRFPR
jgi:hypothetical protein